MIKSESKTVEGGILVERSGIIGTRAIVYAAYIPSPKGVFGTGRGCTIQRFGDQWYVRVGTDPDPALFDHLPAMTAERVKAATAAHDARYEAAYAAILSAYPEAANGRRDMGEITVEQTEMLKF